LRSIRAKQLQQRPFGLKLKHHAPAAAVPRANGQVTTHLLTLFRVHQPRRATALRSLADDKLSGLELSGLDDVM